MTELYPQGVSIILAAAGRGQADGRRRRLVGAGAHESTAEVTADETRLAYFWGSLLVTWQWQLQQVRRGLLPTSYEAGGAVAIRTFLTTSRSFEDHWESVREMFAPEFVEFVEEQRSKAA